MVIIKNHISNRQAFIKILNNNNSGIVIKLTAGWCKHCTKTNVHTMDILQNVCTTTTVYDLDVDENTDVYAYLKAKKMVYGVPALLIYNSNNLTIIPDNMYTGGDLHEISEFLNKQLF